ncbi:MAG: hypothetical protein PHH73_06375, partial [Candidatus Rickettsiella isopodorum]|nr:hypothetical protein [Candidatus Rickettsiella isopodorum]
QAIANQGLGIERMSRVEENKSLAVERIAAADKDHKQAELDYIKTLKELQDLDLSQIQKLITLAQSLKEGAIEDEKQDNKPKFSLQESLSSSNTSGIRG